MSNYTHHKSSFGVAVGGQSGGGEALELPINEGVRTLLIMLWSNFSNFFCAGVVLSDKRVAWTALQLSVG